MLGAYPTVQLSCDRKLERCSKTRNRTAHSSNDRNKERSEDKSHNKAPPGETALRCIRHTDSQSGSTSEDSKVPPDLGEHVLLEDVATLMQLHVPGLPCTPSFFGSEGRQSPLSVQ